MATKFLDAAGLKYAVSKIKTLIAAKQDKLTFDSKPTSGSTNPVTRAAYTMRLITASQSA